MAEKLHGKFEQGQRGLICKRPSDRGPWVVPAHGSKIPEIGEKYYFDVTGTSKGGNLRFARIGESFADEGKRLRAIWLAKIESSLETGNGLTVEYGSVYSSFDVEIEGRTFGFNDVTRSGDGYARNWLQGGDEWLPLLRITPVARAMLVEAKKVYDENRRLEDETRRVHETEWKAEEERKRAEQVAQDAPLVTQFFADHPEAVGWFNQPPNTLTWAEVSKEAIRNKLGVFLREYKACHYASFSKGFDIFDQVWLLTVGGKEVEVVTSYTIEDYGDD